MSCLNQLDFVAHTGARRTVITYLDPNLFGSNISEFYASLLIL